MRFFAVFGIIGFSIACVPERPPADIEPPPTPVLTSKVIWGVVNKPYVKILDEQDSYADVRGILRRGDVVTILSKAGKTDGSGYWLEIRLTTSLLTGWVMDLDVNVYDTEPQARTASKSIREES